MNNILSYAHTIVSLSIHSLMGIYVIFISWLLWMMLEWIWECKFCYEVLISVSLNTHWNVGLVDCMVIIFFTFLRNFHTNLQVSLNIFNYIYLYLIIHYLTYFIFWIWSPFQYFCVVSTIFFKFVVSLFTLWLFYCTEALYFDAIPFV